MYFKVNMITYFGNIVVNVCIDDTSFSKYFIWIVNFEVDL